MPDEILDGLKIQPGYRIIDGTVGGGGHTKKILERSAPTGQVLGLDTDPDAVHRVGERLSTAVADGRLHIAHANFGQIRQVAMSYGFVPVDGILLDLGVSSFQLETPDRGFSLQYDGPLDMRFDPEQEMDAGTIVNTWLEAELADVLYLYGEERRSRRIARFLVRNRPISSTTELAALVEVAVGGRRGQRIHPATRTFQALRIAVNRELTQLENVLPSCLDILKPKGRVAVISFHSLEDRIVKRWVQQEAKSYVQDPSHPRGGHEREPRLQVITPKPLTPSPTEIEQNPRSRSAKLRIAERI